MKNENPNSQEAAGDRPGAAGYAPLTRSERKQIAEILDRRSNEIASFKTDLEEAVSTPVSKVRLYALPGSVELSLSREMSRLRTLAHKLTNLPETEGDDEDA